MKKLFSSLMLISLISATFMLGGCNTMEGVGEDLGAAGDGLSNAAEKSKEY